MAQQYIHSKNQELLWSTYIRIPIVQQISNDQQTSIFRKSVETVYSTISQSNSTYLSTIELQHLNRKTMQTLLSNTKELITPHSSTVPSLIQYSQNPINPSNDYFPPQPQQQPESSYVVETSEERTKRIFEEKQKQFQSFYEKPTLPDPKSMFEEPVQDEDGVIQNVDELIEQYQQERNRDISVNPPLVQQPTANSSIDSHSPVENREELEKKLESLENRIAQLEEFIKNNLVLENIN